MSPKTSAAVRFTSSRFGGVESGFAEVIANGVAIGSGVLLAARALALGCTPAGANVGLTEL
ncbi:MAG: hypothetical protein ABJB66_14440 [Gemmatimonadaceae bacterium]